MTEEVVTFACHARVAQFLIVPHPAPDPPIIAYDARPPGLFRLLGDGVTSLSNTEVSAAAREVRAQCDAAGGDWWVWVGHNQFFFCTAWQFYQCFGPIGWASPKQIASARSFAAVQRMREDKDAAEKAEGKKRAEAARLAKKLGQAAKKASRNMDAIVERING